MSTSKVLTRPNKALYFIGTVISLFSQMNLLLSFSH